MIYKMNKYNFLVFHREYEAFLLKLRTLGVVHIEESQDFREVEDLAILLARRKEIDTLIRSLENRRDKDVSAPQIIELNHEAQGSAVVAEIQQLLDRELRMKQELEALGREIGAMEVWGQFDLSNIHRLEASGYYTHFYTVGASAYDPAWEDLYGVVPINTLRSTVYFVAIQRDGDLSIEAAERIATPHKSLIDLKFEYSQKEREAQEVLQAIRDFANNRMGELRAYDNILADQFNFGNALVQASRQADDRLMVLEGWLPAEDALAMEQVMDADGYYFRELEVKEEDRIPIKLKNNAFMRLFEPITKMFSLPNYHEIDPTPLFAPFFMLFFALCFGDAGYGLLLFVIATTVKRKVSSEMKPACTLFQWLGLTAVPVGLLIGTAFGLVMPWASEGGVFGPVKQSYFLNQDNLMYLAVFVGLLQIVFAKIVAAIKVSIQRGAKYSLAPFAWVVIIIGGALLVGLPAVVPNFPQIGVYLLLGVVITAAMVAFFYNTPGKNPLVNFGSGLWNSYNMASGLLGDTLSYIRLFAIGLTSGILGGVFNDLAWNMTDGSIVMRLLVMPIILLLGHGINFGLAIIGSLVHPLRLTFVEFYKNAEFEGGGKAYTPFKKS